MIPTEMWTWATFLFLGGLHSSVSSYPPSPLNVIFSSVNLKNELQWLPANGTPNDTHFTVQYAIYGDSFETSKGRRVNWRPVPQCTYITQNTCDLTNETWDLENGYNARVRAVVSETFSKWAVTLTRFDPKSDTAFGPPLVNVEVEDNNAIITLKGPMRYQPNNYRPPMSFATLYPQMTYTISIRNTRSDLVRNIPVVSSSHKYKMMEYSTQYCFSANTRLISLPVRCLPSDWLCITTPRDPMTDQLERAILGIVVPSLCISVILLLGYLLYQYLRGKGQKSPHILEPPSFHSTHLTLPSEKISIVLLSVIKHEFSSDSNGTISNHEAHKNRHLRYIAQRPGTPFDPEEQLDNLSVTYGVIETGPRNADERKEDGEDRGANGRNNQGAQQQCVASRSYKKKEYGTGNNQNAKVGSLLPKSYLPQRSAHTNMQTQLPINTWTDWSIHVQAHDVFAQNFVGPSRSGADKRDADTQIPGTYMSQNPQTEIPLNLKTKTVEGAKEVTEEITPGKIHEGVEEETEGQEIPLLASYVSQNTHHKLTCASYQSDFISDACSVDDEEEDQSIRINWDPETRKLVMPKMNMALCHDGGLDGLADGGKEKEDGMKGEEEKNDELCLQSVYRSLGCEEKAAAQQWNKTVWEVDDIETRWNLVISNGD